MYNYYNGDRLVDTIHGVRLAQGETVIREYEASSLIEPAVMGYVVATNRRLIFTGNAQTSMGSSLLVRDTKIDNVVGVTGGLTYERSINAIIIGAVMALIGVILLFMGFIIYAIAALLIGGFVMYKGWRAGGTHMYMNVMTTQSAPAFGVSVAIRRGWFSSQASGEIYTMVAAAAPGRDTEQMIRELGAVVQDIQQMGDAAIARWQQVGMEGNHAIPVTPSTGEQVTAAVDLMKTTTTKLKDITVATTEAAKKMKEDAALAKQQKALCECSHQNAPNALFCAACGQKL